MSVTVKMIKEIAKKMCDYDRLEKLVLREENYRKMEQYLMEPWSIEKLSNGIPGLCMLYGELSEQFPSEGWELEGHKYLEKIVAYIGQNGLSTPSMFSGASGIALACTCLSGNGTRYQKFIGSLNSFIVQKVPPILHANQGVGAIITHYDVIEGVSGILSYLLLHKETNTVLPVVEETIGYLIKLTDDIDYQGKRIPGWYVTSENQFSISESDYYNNGNFNTSMSHGVAGIMAALSLAIREGIELEGQKDAIRKILEFLKEYAVIDNRTVWNGQISLEDYLSKKQDRTKLIRRDAWCYGNIGICYAFILAGDVLDDKAYIDYGIKVLHETLNDIRGIFAPSFCHGYSGILQTVQAVEANIHRDEFAEEKEVLIKKILSFYDESYVYGFQNIELENNVARKFDYPGLLDGVAGICLTLLNNELGMKTPWSRAFMLI